MLYHTFDPIQPYSCTSFSAVSGSCVPLFDVPVVQAESLTSVDDGNSSTLNANERGNEPNLAIRYRGDSLISLSISPTAETLSPVGRH
jgi:hypothetical protein